MEEFINEMLNLGECLSRCINKKEIEETYEEARVLYKEHLESISKEFYCGFTEDKQKCSKQCDFCETQEYLNN